MSINITTYKTNCFGCHIEMELEDKHPEGPLRQLHRMALHFCDECVDGWDEPSATIFLDYCKKPTNNAKPKH